MNRSLLVLLAASVTLHGCKTNSKKSSEVLDSRSSDICKDVDNYTKSQLAENSDQNGITVFERRKDQEVAILNDLIKSYHLAAERLKTKKSVEKTYAPTTVEKNHVNADKICAATPKIKNTFPPEHYQELSRPADFDNAIGFYCNQRTKLGDQCRFSRVDSTACAVIGADKPQWITDSCQVNEKLMSNTLSQLAYEGCNALASNGLKASASNKNCEEPILQAICYSHFSAGKDLIGHLNTYGVGKTDQEVALEQIAGTFRTALANCIGSIAQQKLVSILKNADALKLTSAQKAARFVIGKQAAYNAIHGIQESAKATSLKRKVTKQMALTLCTATAQSIAASIDAAPTKTYNNACGERTPLEQKARTASCLRTTADICQSATGVIDFAGIYAEYDQKSKPGMALSSTLEFASLTSGQLCELGGETSSLACGAISSASKEILRTLRDGNNSWAECLGTSKLGACAGERYVEWLTGMSTRSSEAPISQPTMYDGDEIRACCQCQKVYYSDGWLEDTKFRRDSLLMGVTSVVDGGADQTSCTQYEKGPKTIAGALRKGEKVYFQTEHCRQVVLKNAPNCQSPDSVLGRPLPKTSLDGMPFTGRVSAFGPDKIYLGTEVCLDGDC